MLWKARLWQTKDYFRLHQLFNDKIQHSVFKFLPQHTDTEMEIFMIIFLISFNQSDDDTKNQIYGLNLQILEL